MSLRKAAVLASTAALVAAGSITLSSAHADPTHFYVALGDSYSAGEGTYTGNSGWDAGTAANGCHRSNLSWTRLLTSARLGLTMAGSWGGSSSPTAGHLACSGARTKAFEQKHNGEDPQLQHLGQLSPKPDLVTVTIGGNDAGFADVLAACYAYGRLKCESKISDARKKITAMGDCGRNPTTCLAGYYRRIKPYVSTGRVVVVGYPKLFATNTTAYTYHCTWAPLGDLGKLNDLAGYADDTIREQARQAGVDFVDVRDVFKDHELCTGSSWVRSITILSGKYDSISGHPLREGQEAIERVVADYLRAHPVLSPSPVPPPPSAPPTPPVPTVNQLPVARFTYSRLSGPGNRVVLDGGSSFDPDGTIGSWSWSSGTQAIPAGRTATVSFAGNTAPKVTLTVKDDRGATATTTRTLSLPNRAPAISRLTPDGGVVGSNQPRLSVSASDPDADALQYSFHVTGPSVDISSGWVASSWDVPAHRLDPGTRYTWSVSVRDTAGATAAASGSFTVAMLPTAADVVATPSGAGYWQVASDGGVFSYGDAQFYGSLPGLGIHLGNITGMVRTPDGAGYWLVGADGGVFAFGDAQFYGSLPGLGVHVANIVGMAATKTGSGYWLVGSDGGVFAFGDAGFHGSMGGQHLNKPVVAIAPTASGEGYWLAAVDGGIFSYGDAAFHGSMGSQPLNAPVVDMDATPDGGGYWMTAEDGGVFAFGNAGFFGSLAGQALNGHITGMSVTPTARGYWLNGCDGGIFAFGDAGFHGSNPTYQCRGT